MIYGDKVLFPIESVVISYIDLLHSTNFPELIPLWTTAAHLEKTPHPDYKTGSESEASVIRVCCTRGSHWKPCFFPPLICSVPYSTHCWPPLLLDQGQFGKPLLPVQELTDGEWVLITRAVIFQTFSIKWGWKQAMRFLMVLRGYSISSCLSSSGHSCTQWQILGQHQFTESPVNIHNCLLCNFWPQHCIRLSPIP